MITNEINELYNSSLVVQNAEIKDVILLHGLFGSLSNWYTVKKELSGAYNIYTPKLPLYEVSLREGKLDALVRFLDSYIVENGMERATLVGNSLGGHIALLYTLKYPQKVERLVLAGSSGLYENSFNGTFPRVKDYDYIADKVKQTFYKKEVVSDELIAEVFETVQSKVKTLSIIALARAAQKQNLTAVLHQIKAPVLLIWGLQDEVTPPHVAVQFEKLLPNAELCFIDECGHVPMMEQPELFNKYLKEFLES